MKVFQEFFANAILPRGMLSYFITLIPKVTNPHSISEFRPISLLGSLYKIVAKVLATRLGAVMGNLISKNQSAFIKGRLLVDGVLAINEVVDLAMIRSIGCSWNICYGDLGLGKSGLVGLKHVCVPATFPCLLMGVRPVR
jgi:hypothetical protein